MDYDNLTCFQSLAENAPEGMLITSSNDTIVYINPSACKMLDYDANGSLPTIMPTEEILSGKRPKSIYYNNKILSVSVEKVKLETCPYYFWYITDISKQEQQDEKLYCLKTILDCVDEGIIMSDSENMITLYNEPYAKFENLPQEQVVGKHMDEVYDSNQHITVLKTGMPLLDGYNRYFSYDGQEQEGMGKTYPVVKDNKVIAAFSIVRNVKEIRWLLQKAVEFQGAQLQRVASNGTKYTFKSIIGESEIMVDTINEAKILAISPSPVLVYGETGTGKELFAQSLHNAGSSADQPFVAINCAAVPESLLESVLFGTVKGSFTGAQNSKGVFEQAGTGTLFLDEINSMPMAMQTKLLRVLQEKSVRRVGATYEIPVKCRIITSSNEQPEECVQNSILRNDLYYRLSLLRINIPPLRERGRDIEVLAKYFLKSKARLYGKKNVKLSTEFINYLYQHPWPGNVRELEHTIESCVAVIEDGEEVQLYHLPTHLRHSNNSNKIRTKLDVFHSTSSTATKTTSQSEISAGSSQDEQFPEGSQATSKSASAQDTASFNEPFDNLDTPTLAAALREVEEKVILTSLQNHQWNISRAAKTIGIGRQNLQYRMKKLNIKRPSGGPSGGRFR